MLTFRFSGGVLADTALAKREDNLGIPMGDGHYHCFLIRAEVDALDGVLFLYCAVMTTLCGGRRRQ